MAEERRIIVEIVSRTENNSSNSNAGGDDPKELPGSQQNIKEKNENYGNTAKVVGKMAWNNTKSFIGTTVSAVTNRYFSLSENYVAETDYNNFSAMINKGKSLVSTVAAGYLTGGVAGAAISAVAWGTNEFISYQNRMSGYYQALNATNYQTQFDRSRLGLTNEGKGTEN